MPVEAAGSVFTAPPVDPAQAESHSSSGLYYSLLGLALAAAIIPLWLVRYTGMMDYTAHLARCYILAHFHSDPMWQRFYRVDFGPIPNLAIDLIVTPLAHWLPIVVSGKIFLTLTAILYVTGCDALGRAAWGERHWMALLAGFTFFNSNLLDGRVNFVFGMALFFWVFALWLRARHRMTPRRFLLFCGLSLIVYLAHLGAVALLGEACVTVALLDYSSHRRPARVVAQVGWLACPTLLLLFGFLRRNGRVGHILWGNWAIKAAHTLTLVQTFHGRLDAALLLACALCAAVLLLRARWQHELVAAGLVFLACYLAFPMKLFTSYYADARFVAPGFVLLMIAMRPRPGRVRAAALGVVMVIFLARIVYIARDWMAMDAEASQVLAMGATLPLGSRVDVADRAHRKTGALGYHRLVLRHTVDYWSISRGVYVSNLFAVAGQQPLIQREDLQNCIPGEGKDCLAHFDYVWTDAPAPRVLARLQSAAVPVARVRTFTLWRVR